ncbi:hypothetical protein JR316_0010404 [Psilocybe cubensis]|uniref:Uncharacterized protein n=2 Tax=Psilocybe cubensis TaxID=181762 RepID=A0ACB8GM73_PSICU|nr:hypothetical protein JR316_0010404 [Psilocybe cubensis]KAH9476492.1 hypothetical protein JR316_0010404 [Psilocybe cubensis]
MEPSLKAETSNGNLAGNVIETTNFSLKQSHNEQGNILSLQVTKEHTHSVESPSHYNANIINARRELTGHTCEQQETRTGNDDDIYIEDEELQYPQSPSSSSKDTPSSPVAPFPHCSRTDQHVDFDRIQQQVQQPPIQHLPPRSQAYSYAYLQSTAQLDARVHDNDQESLSDPLSCPAAASPSHKIEVSPIPSKSDIGVQVSEFQLGIPSTTLEQKITRLLEEAAAERREMVSSIRRLEKRIETLQNDTGRVHTCSCSVMKPQTCKRKRADEDLEVVIGH